MTDAESAIEALWDAQRRIEEALSGEVGAKVMAHLAEAEKLIQAERQRLAPILKAERERKAQMDAKRWEADKAAYRDVVRAFHAEQAKRVERLSK